MRCHLKKCLLVAVGLFVVITVYTYKQRSESTGPMTWIGDRETWPEDLKNHYLLFNISINVLAGVPRESKKYLTVGLASVKRVKSSYLQDTLQSIFSQSSEEELNQMVVVVHLADFDEVWVLQTLQTIMSQFIIPLSKGQLLIIHVNQKYYPPLTGLKRNFNDAPDRVSYRSKQNVDYAYLLLFSSNLSQYYLMLEDDVSCSVHFLSRIREHINSLKSSKWATLEFSKLGYIGKLYQSQDVPVLARFLYNFYQEMPCDYLMSHFRTLLMQDKVIRFVPSLFQHMGTYSSFKGTYKDLKDDDYVEETADNPPADISTDMSVYQTYTADKAYSQRQEYFWGVSPIESGNYFLVVFHQPALLSRVQVLTGIDGKGQLQSADVDLARFVVRKESSVECSQFYKLGSLNQGRFNEPNVQKHVNTRVMCVRIQATAPQADWVVIRNIQVWTVKRIESNQWF